MIKTLFSLLLIQSAMSSELSAQSHRKNNSSRPNVTKQNSLNASNNTESKHWTDYLSTLDTSMLEEECKPAHFKPKVPGKNRGVAVLFHGFTACPQQWFEVGKAMANAGFEVFIPLLPGHGIKRLANRKHLAFLPQPQKSMISSEPNPYLAIAHLANQLTHSSDSSQINVLGGISGGGTVALRAALIENKRRWHRLLLLAPLYGVSPVQDVLSKVLMPFFPKLSFGYGTTCENENNKGRGGYCEFSLGSIRALLEFSQETLRSVNDIKVKQFHSLTIGVLEDNTVSNAKIMAIHEKMSIKASQHQLCFLPKAVPHSMLSRFENLHLDQKWIPRLERVATQFLSKGQNVETMNSTEGPLCFI